MVHKCVMLQSESSSAKSFSLSKEARDFVATNAYRIAKTIATKADYDVRQ
jgi:hypothetical protein